MNKLLISLAVSMASIPSFATNVASWEIVNNPVSGSETGFPMTATGRQLFADFNNDGILDYFIIAGQSTSNIGLYKGNADGTYTDVTANSPDLYSKNRSSALFIDINNDGNLDLITVGDMAEKSPITDIYMNSGAPEYKFVMDIDKSIVLPSVYTESNDNNTKIICGADFNNDGWTDLLINGNAAGKWEAPDGNDQLRVVAIMLNNQGNFELLRNPVDGKDNFIEVNGGCVDVGDYNNDGFMDVLVTGYHDDLKTVTRLYKNNGNSTFTEVTGINFVGHQQGETAFIDVNNDGLLDIIEIGRDVNNDWANFGKLYINNGNDTFTRHEEATTNMFGGSCALAIGDMNNDGLMDFYMTGWGTNSTCMYNKGDNSFLVNAIDPDAARCRAGSNVLADVNKDGFLDLAVFGYRDGGEGGYSTWPDFILLNKGGNGITANAAPTAPQGVKKTYNSTKGCYELQWNAPTDDTTPSAALRYNVYVKDADGKINFLAPADKATGMLKSPGTQYPFCSGTKYEVYTTENANVEIGVQAIDNGLAGSTFTVATLSSVESEIVNDNDCIVVVNGTQATITNNAEEAATIEVITIDGSIVAKEYCAGNNTITVELPLGVSIVKATTVNSIVVKKAIVR